MTNFSQLSQELGRLTSQFDSLNTFLSRTPLNKYLRSQDRFTRQFERFMNLPVMKQGISELKKFGNSMQEMSELQSRSLATNKNLISTISIDLVKASFQNGISLRDLSTEIISLREEGVQKLDKSTLGLLARMKATGQSTDSLIKFLGANTSVLMMNQSEAQNLAFNLATYSRIYQTRQDDILRLATSISKSFEVQSQLGAGAGLTGGFAALGATLGGRGADLIGKASQFFAKASLSQLQLLGVAEGFQERLAMESNPEKQKAIIEQMVKTAADSVNRLKGGLGTDVTSSKIFEQLLKPFGGEAVLIFPQLTKALEDANDPIFDLSQSLTGFNSAAEAFALPMQYLGAALNALLSTPFIGTFVKALAAFAGAVVPYAALVKIMRMISFLNQHSARTQVMAAQQMNNAAVINLRASRMSMIGGGIFGALGIVAAIATMFTGISSDIDDINRKTPEQLNKNNNQANLNDRILSQLVNIVTTDNNSSMQKELLATQKELLRVAKQQAIWSDPNNSSPSRSFQPRT